MITWVEKEKSVIGRAVAGGLVLGPIGAIVGGLSGLGKKKIGRPDFLIINFWETSSEQATPQTLLFCDKGKEMKFKKFANKINGGRDKWKESI